MGNANKKSCKIEEKPNRKVFVTFKTFRQVLSEYFGSYVVYTFVIRYHRFVWEVDIRFNELIRLDRKLFKEFPVELSAIDRPPKFSKIFWQHDQRFLTDRANMMNKYLQDLLDNEFFIDNLAVRKFLACSIVSFNPDFGRKGKEGYLKKCSGGYIEKFSRKAGDFINVWKWRWMILTDAGIMWFHGPDYAAPLGLLQVDQEFTIVTVGRVITLSTATRRLLFYSSTIRGAQEWTEEIKRFYSGVPRTIQQSFSSSFPPRINCYAQVYTLPKDYFQSLTIALLGAQKEIFITSWKNSPGVLLTRPPLPPLRLDQILKYKANQGVQIYVLLYKEVEYIGQSNDSFGVKKSLENLSPNIHVIRHPNKFIGGSTAVLWSHHEKLVVVDRLVISESLFWLIIIIS
jgi:phospholipase D1/2